MDGGKIRLHKLTSNRAEVLNEFDSKDLAEGVTELNFEHDGTFLQRSLGLTWDVIKDCFTFHVSTDQDKPFTKRGLLSVINGVFDPIGFVAPVVLKGRIILRQAIQNNSLQWDDLLPSDILSEWQGWKDSLKDLQFLEIPRAYMSASLDGRNCELYVFCDASKEAIAAVAYIRSLTDDSKFGFVFGKSKLAPTHGHTIPRLELCAALLGTEIAMFIQKQLGIEPQNTHFYTDSQVVLGYIYNETRRFYVYVANRVDKILKATSKQQWHFVPTELNPANCGTRPMNASKLQESVWLRGPNSTLDLQSQISSESFEIIEPESDKEIVTVKKSEVHPTVSSLGSHRFERFSTWIKLVKAIAFLKQRISKYHNAKTNFHDSRSSVDFMRESEMLILKEVQSTTFESELEALKVGQAIPRKSHILDLSPVLDSRGLLCLGGRLSRANLSISEKSPVIIPGKVHIATLLTQHFHEIVRHQGRHLTEGAIRSNGFWVTGGNTNDNKVPTGKLGDKQMC